MYNAAIRVDRAEHGLEFGCEILSLKERWSC